MKVRLWFRRSSKLLYHPPDHRRYRSGQRPDYCQGENGHRFKGDQENLPHGFEYLFWGDVIGHMLFLTPKFYT